jgi:plastocyanin
MVPVEKTIVETAVADGRFTTLVAALQAAKLDGTLSGTGPYTVFAPTDDAFKKLPNGTLATLLKDPEGKLKQVLLYHVVSGNVMSDDAMKLTMVKTVQGDNITFSVKDGSLMVNNATVIIKDIKSSNGIIHVIDTVLLPPEKTPVATPTPKPQPSVTITFTTDMTVMPGTTVYIPVGGKVIWTNKDPLKPHGVQAINDQTGKYFGGMDTITIPYGKSLEVTFDKVGGYDYTTTFQPQTLGKIVVTA